MLPDFHLTSPIINWRAQHGMWQAAQPVARKFPRRASGAVVGQVIAVRSVSKKPDSVQTRSIQLASGELQWVAAGGARSLGAADDFDDIGCCRGRELHHPAA